MRVVNASYAETTSEIKLLSRTSLQANVCLASTEQRGEAPVAKSMCSSFRVYCSKGIHSKYDDVEICSALDPNSLVSHKTQALHNASSK